MNEHLVVIARGPHVRQWLEDLARDRERCKAEGHLHPPIEMDYNPISRQMVLRCSNCDEVYERPAYPEEIQAYEDIQSNKDAR